MAIDFIPFDELFAPEYQLNYITTSGYINVGPHSYNVLINYTIKERQRIFQVCEKYLPWEYTQEQEQWERTMYMYQFVIKSPPPFPYLEYPLSENIIMAKTYKKKDKDTLIVTHIISETHITEENRAEIQTQLDHLEFDKTELQKKIDVLKDKIAILDK